jgi:hypothetical protein
MAARDFRATRPAPSERYLFYSINGHNARDDGAVDFRAVLYARIDL